MSLREAVTFVLAALGGQVPEAELLARLDSRLTGRGDVTAYLAGGQRFAAFRSSPVVVEELRERGEWTARALVAVGDEQWELDVAISPSPPHRIVSFQPRPVAGELLDTAVLRAADHWWSALDPAPTGEISRGLAAVADEQQIVGLAAGIAVNGSVAYRGCFGLTDRESGTPVEASSVFRVGSVTKMVTALAVLKLVEDGTISLSTPLDGLEPGGTVPTVGQALVHTAGLPKDMRPPFRVAWEPGERAEYSNVGYALLARTVARAAGVPFTRYCASEILEPRGLRHTTMQERGVAAPADVTGYRVAGGRVAPAPPAVAPLPGAGGMTSDLDDLLTLTGLFTRGAPVVVDGPFAPGFAIRDDLLWRGGATDGFTAEIVAALDGSCDVVLLASKSPPEGLREVARVLMGVVG